MSQTQFALILNSKYPAIKNVSFGLADPTLNDNDQQFLGFEIFLQKKEKKRKEMPTPVAYPGFDLRGAWTLMVKVKVMVFASFGHISIKIMLKINRERRKK